MSARMPARIRIDAVAPLPGIAATAPLYVKTPLEAATTLLPVTSQAVVNSRMAVRIAVEGSIAFPVEVGTVGVAVRTAVRRAITVARLFVGPSSTAVLLSRFERSSVAAEVMFPAPSSTAAVMARSTMQRAVAAARTFGPLSRLATNAQVMMRTPVRVRVEAVLARFTAITLTTTLDARDSRRPEVEATAVFPAVQHDARLLLLRPAGKAIDAVRAFPVPSFNVQVEKRAAMPPGIVTGLLLVIAAYRSLRVRWLQPDLGTGQFLNYEWRVGTGPWHSTQSQATETEVTGLDPDTQYSITIRAVTTVGRGSASMPLIARTLAVSPPTIVRFFSADRTGGGSIDLVYEKPVSDGGADIDYYEVCVINEDDSVEPFEPTTGAVTSWRVRGLAIGHRYGFRVRAVNAAGAGPHTAIVYETAELIPTLVVPAGQRIPLLDTDRQSLIVRLADQDCLIRVWWQPSDQGWWGSLEVPTNTPAVQSRRLALNAGLLDRITDVLPGNIVMRERGNEGLEPGRDAWSRPTHGLIWEPR